MKCADNPHAEPSKNRTLWRFSDFADRERGAFKEEIAEALGVRVSVNAGAAFVCSTHTLDAFEAVADINGSASK